MPQKTNTELLTAANTIKNETNPLANTAIRLGNVLVDVIESKVNPVNNLDTDVTLATNSDLIIPSQKAIKAYVDGKVAYDKGYLEYRVRLAQSGTSNPSIQYTFVDQLTAGVDSSDPLFLRVSFSRVGVGEYKLTITTLIANPIASSKLDISTSDAKVRFTALGVSSSSPFAFVEYTFKSYDTTGTQADSVIAFTNIYLRLYS